MSKRTATALIIAALEAQGCASPQPENTKLLTDSQEELMSEALDNLEFHSVFQAEILKRSEVDLVDVSGNEFLTSQVDEDFDSLVELGRWFLDHNRFVSYNRENNDIYTQDIADGFYRSYLGQESNNDWIGISEDLFEPDGSGEVSMQALSDITCHELVHFPFGSHSEKMDDFLFDQDGQIRGHNSSEILNQAIKLGDAPHIYDKTLTLTIQLYEHLVDIHSDFYYSITKDARAGEISPQQAYDRAWEKYGDPDVFLEWRIKEAYSDGAPFGIDEILKILKISQEDLLEAVKECPWIIKEQQIFFREELREFVSEFEDDEIETIEEREQREQRERKAASLDGYRLTR